MERSTQHKKGKVDTSAVRLRAKAHELQQLSQNIELKRFINKTQKGTKKETMVATHWYFWGNAAESRIAVVICFGILVLSLFPSLQFSGFRV